MKVKLMYMEKEIRFPSKHRLREMGNGFALSPKRRVPGIISFLFLQ